MRRYDPKRRDSGIGIVAMTVCDDGDWVQYDVAMLNIKARDELIRVLELKAGGRCKTCKHYVYHGNYDEECTCQSAWVDDTRAYFGCIHWVAK